MSLLQGTSPDGPARNDAVQLQAKKVLSVPSGDDSSVTLSDRIGNATRVVAADAQILAKSLARYRDPNHGRSVVEILITVVPFVGQM